MLERREIAMMEKIDKCATNIGKTTVETRAYLRALSENKGLDLGKHVAQIEQEMDKDDKSEKGLFYFFIFAFPYKIQLNF